MKNRKGFTLTELLVVMVILGIIIGISIPIIRNIQNVLNQKKYDNYLESIVTAAKLYKDSYEEDLFGHNENGCSYVSYSQLAEKNLIKDIEIDKISCNSDRTFVRILKIKDKYAYAGFLGCGKKKNGAAENVTIAIPRDGVVHTMDTSYCTGTELNNLLVTADLTQAGTAYDKKKKKTWVTIKSATGIENTVRIYATWKTDHDYENATNWKKIDFTIAGNQEQEILNGNIIETKSNEFLTPEGATGRYYLLLRVDYLRDLYGNDWKNPNPDTSDSKYLYFGPFSVDNTNPQIQNLNIVSNVSGHNDLDVKVNFNAVDETEASKLLMCISEDSSACTKKADFVKYENGKVRTLSGSFDGKSRTLYVSLRDLAGNVDKKSATYTVSNRRTITYNSNNGTGCSGNKYIYYMNGETPKYGDLCTPTRTGYTFTGWSTASNSTNVIYDNTEYHGSHASGASGYTDFKQYTVSPSFSSGDVYQLDVDVKGTGPLYTYFYGQSGYLQVSKWQSSDGRSGTNTDGFNSIPLTSSYTHYTVTYTLGSTGNGSLNKYVLFRAMPGSNIYIKNVRFHKISSSSQLVNSQTNYDTSKASTTIYATWKINQYSVTCEDWFVDASNGRKTKLGTQTAKTYNYGASVSGTAWGTDGATSKYYTGYAYKGASTKTVGTSGNTVYRYFWAWNDINVFNPDGVQKGDGSVATFSVSYNGGSWITGQSNEDGSKIVLPYGATIKIKDITMKAGYNLKNVTWDGTAISPSSGVYTVTVTKDRVNLNINSTTQTYYLDLNGYLNGSNSGNISGFGTADVYVNGVLKSDNCTDFYQQVAYGSTYEIKDIKGTTGHKYDGVREGSLTGTVKGTTGVRLSFSTKKVVVTFKPNGGTGSDATQTFTYGVSGQSFSAKGYSRSGWTQGNWAEASNGSGLYSIQSGVSDGWIDSKSPSITLYATWRDTTNPTTADWESVGFKETRINSTSSARTTITGIGSDNQSGLQKLQYYTTCNSGTTTGTSSSPIERSIYSGQVTIDVTRCNRPVLHYRVIDNGGNAGAWKTGGALAERMMYAQYYNYLMYYGGTASNNAANLSSFVNSPNPVKNNIDAMIDNSSTYNAVKNLSNRDTVIRAYRSILGREAGESEINGWVNSLNGGQGKQSMLHDFNNSGESVNSIKGAWGY